MNSTVKKFIEINSDDLDDLNSLFESAYIEFDNEEFDEFVKLLNNAGIETLEACQHCFYTEFSLALSWADWSQGDDPWIILPTFLEDMMNSRCGLSYEQIVEYLQKEQYNLNIRIERLERNDGIWSITLR